MIGTIGNPVLVKEKPNYAIKNVALFKKSKNIISKYLKLILEYPSVINKMKNEASGKNQKFVPLVYLRSFKIPLPPLDIQQKIVDEIEEVENAEKKYKELVYNLKSSISGIFNTYKKGKLSNLCKVINTKCKPQDEINYYYVGLEHIESNTGIVNETFESGTNLLSAKNIYYENCVLYGKLRPYLNKVAVVKNNGVCSTDIVVLQTKVPLILKYILLSNNVLEQAKGKMKGVNHPRISVEDLLSLDVPVPPIEEQQKIVYKIEKLEQEINNAQQIIDESKNKKQQILDKYLK